MIDPPTGFNLILHDIEKIEFLIQELSLSIVLDKINFKHAKQTLAKTHTLLLATLSQLENLSSGDDHHEN